MDAERWRRVEQLYHSARERKPSDREAFLAEMCTDDDEVRREVELLLAQNSSDTFLEWRANLTDPASLTELSPGAHLGPYRIETALGSGGMGQVFRGVDTRLGRNVAIKVCAERFSARFEREARAISALNHPNICTLYDVGSDYLVMELVEGETLAEKIKKGPLPQDRVFSYGAQIADALATAHAKGITHRDLKPANIMLAKSGVKVLDFGLAKIARPSDISQSESLTASQTVMGTLGYMAPEQLEGKECDARTDIFSLGVVLYEMAAGKKAFTGESQAALIAEMMRCEVKPLESMPERFVHIVDRCLARDPDDRWQTAKDVAAELSWAGKAQQHSEQAIEFRKIAPRWRWGWVAALMAVGLVLGWAAAHLRRVPAETRLVRLTVTPPAGTEFLINSGSAISPDGRLLAFVTTSASGVKLWIRPLNSTVARELPGTENAAYPFWSPDSRSVGFFASGKLKRAEIDGGPPTVICDVGAGRGGTWNQEGTILFNGVNDGPLLRVSAAGGTAVPVTTVDIAQRENSHRWPQFLSERQFLYVIRNSDSSCYSSTRACGVYLGSLDRPQEKVRVLTANNAVWGPDPDGKSGRLFWVRDGMLMAQQLDPDKGQLTGEAVAVADSVAVGLSGSTGAPVSISRAGTLFFGDATVERHQLTWYSRDGKSLGELGSPDQFYGLRISPDGTRVALTLGFDVWQMELSRGIPTRVTFSSGHIGTPVWSPDGQRIVYSNGAPPNLFVQSSNGTGAEERLIESHDSLLSLDWSRDGRFFMYQLNSNDVSSRTQADIWLLPMIGDRKPILFHTTSFREKYGQFSPDGKWIAYTSDESGRNEIFARNFAGVKKQVSNKGGDWVRWPKSDELYYVALDRKLMSVDVRTVNGFPEFGIPKPLFTLPWTTENSNWQYDVMPDGQRILALAPVANAGPPMMTVVLNWQSQLKATQR